jgi:hypothetical protein
VRTVISLAALLVSFVGLPTAPGRVASAQESIVMEGAGGAAMAADRSACGCRNLQSPPWHGSVAGEPCGPSCPPPTLFHANPCGQLWMKHNARQQGCVLPPCFPRMHGWLADGVCPTPRPIALPRCPNCGTHIEFGM